MDGLRIDKWLWFARFCKSRSLAQSLVAEDGVRLNGRVIGKASVSVKPGDLLLLRLGRQWRKIEVLALGGRRGGAAQAQALYQVLAPPATTPDGELLED